MEDLVLNFAGYAGRRVLVTGHSGFKGGWLILCLQGLGARVSGIGLPPETTPSLFESARIGDGIDSHFADIRDAQATARLIGAAEPEIVFHLAAQPLVRRGYREPLATLATNVMGTAHVLEAARRAPSVRAVVVVTTDKCYADRGWPWGYRETDRLGGADPYSVSKACAELISAAWRTSYGDEPDAPLIATVRAGNVIGGGDWAEDRLVPDLVRAARRGQPATIRNPAAVRPWQHVLEPLVGYLLLGARLLAGEREFADAWNFGPAADDMQPVAALCDALCPALGGRWTHDGSRQPTETPALRLDSSRAIQALGWHPRWRLGEALALTADWYARYYAGEDASSLCKEQIATMTTTFGDCP